MLPALRWQDKDKKLYTPKPSDLMGNTAWKLLKKMEINCLGDSPPYMCCVYERNASK